MSRLLLSSHPACLLHDAGAGHPERPGRVEAALAGVRGSGLEVVERAAPRIDLDLLRPVHADAYVRMIEEACAAGGGHLDPDTAVVADSWEASLRAAGAGIDAVQSLRRGEADAAFLAIRPPGHHAGPAAARGFCLFNNVAVAAEYVAAAGETVAIVDWDVHHGDGTQETFYERSDVLYMTIHQFPFYPGSGWVDETGLGAGHGFTINVAVPAFTAGDVLAAAVEEIYEPVLREFRPDWLFISAGYDAHRADPLAELHFESSDYGWAASRLAAIRPGRTVVFLEGGYDLAAIEASAAATAQGLGGTRFPRPVGSSPQSAWRMFEMARDEASRHWEGVQGGRGDCR